MARRIRGRRCRRCPGEPEDAAELRGALLAPARALRARIERLRADGRGEPFQDLSLPELSRLTVTAARAFAQIAQVERSAHGLTTGHVGAHETNALVPPDVERMTVVELEAYLTAEPPHRALLTREPGNTRAEVENDRPPSRVSDLGAPTA
jgi:hypothetical protein